MANMEEIKKLTIQFQSGLHQILKLQDGLSNAYIDKLIDMGLEPEEATELYLEATAMTGKCFFGKYDDDSEISKRFLEMMDGE